MGPTSSRNGRVLVLDTCGERASLSLHKGTALIGEAVLTERTASKSILQAVRNLLEAHDLSLPQLDGLGIVHGPGSFTGVRVGLALAKGLCEAANLRCAPVSRLATLAHAAELRDGYALLAAGRGQVYVRMIGGDRAEAESMVELSTLLPQLSSRVVAVAEAQVAEVLQGWVASLQTVELTARRAIDLVLDSLAQGGADLATLDANYLRDEGAIYARGRRPRARVMDDRQAYPPSTIALATANQLAEVIAFAALSADAPHWPLAAWQSFLEPARANSAVLRCLFTLRQDGEIAGVIAVATLGEVAELELLLVRPTLRRRGIGRALTMHWVHWAEEGGAREAVLEVRASNRAAQELYRMLGFTIQGVRSRYYTEPLEDALLLHRELGGNASSAVASALA